ncbi:SLC13 family permease [Naasia lichenicola]
MAVIGLVLLIVGTGASVLRTGSLDSLAPVAERVLPVLVFVVCITVVAELAAKAEVFRWLAERAATWGRGRAVALWGLVAAIAVVSTVFLSLDTTAVLLTPIVIILARHVGLPALPFALTTVWLANTASLLLPVSNLSNLLAATHIGGASEFVSLLALPFLLSVAATLLVLGIVFFRDLRRKYTPEPSEPVADQVLFLGASGIVVALVPALVSGIEVWIPALIGAILMIGLFVWRRPRALHPNLIPAGLVLFASGLFVVVDMAHQLGMTAVTSVVAGTGTDPIDLFRLAATGALGANAIDNLPAYLVLEQAASDDPLRLAALLIGVNCGPLITPWASLATLLWHRSLVSMGVSFGWGRYMLLGLVAAPVIVAAATLGLLVH